MSFHQLFNRQSAKTTAQPSRIRVRQHVIAKKVAEGQHGLTPDRIARITASAKQREYRERQRNFPVAPKVTDDGAPLGDKPGTEGEAGVVAPLHNPSGEQPVLANKACGESHIPDDATCHAGAGEDAAKKARDVAHAQSLVRGDNLRTSPSDGPMVERINKHTKEMSDAGREYASVSAHKDSKDPVLKAQHDASYERIKAAHVEQQSIAAKMAGFDDVKQWVESRRVKVSNSETLANAAVAIESVRRQLTDIIREDPRFKIEGNTQGITPSPWVQDLLTPDNDGVWQAILSRPHDGRMVKVGFVFVDGKITMLPGEPVNVGMEVIYNRDPERLGIAVDVTDKLSNRFTVPTDGWVHLAPFGKHPHPTGVVQVIDEKSVDAMVANFASRKTNDKNFTGALLDFDHFSQSGDKPSEAGGWIENLAKREDGMWGQVRWTDVGEKAVNGGRYRLVSPVWLKRNCETLDNGQLRPLVLDSVALTNEPNLKGLTPISR